MSLALMVRRAASASASAGPAASNFFSATLLSAYHVCTITWGNEIIRRKKENEEKVRDMSLC